MIGLRKGQKGFTLIEIMAAVTLLGIILLPIQNLFLSNIKTTADSNKISIATSLAQDRIEQLKAMSKDNLLLMTMDQNVEEINSNNITFERITDVNQEDSNLFNLAVRVRTKGGKAYIVTYVFKE